MDKDIHSVLPLRPLPGTRSESRPATGRDVATSFEKVLQKQLGTGSPVKVSLHAERRLQERNINLSPEDFVKINRAVRQAEAKGARESLILYGDLALITSIKNKTVVTAMDGKSVEDHVFTNIDSAVIVK